MGDGLLCSSDPVEVQRYEVVDVNDYGEETRAWTTVIIRSRECPTAQCLRDGPRARHNYRQEAPHQ